MQTRRRNLEQPAVTEAGRLPRRAERGASMAEIVVILALVAVAIPIVGSYSLRWLNAEDLRSNVYQAQMLAQMARVEAITRNRSCRFVLDTSARRMQVVDLNDPANSSDDITLSDTALSSKVNFADPSGGAAISLASLGGGKYQTTFASDGSVSAGIGAVSFEAKETYLRLSLFGAGGVKLETWSGGAWKTSS